MIPKDPPSGWGDDEITNFIDTARTNAYASFANLPAEYKKLAQIDGVLRKLADNLHNTKDLLPSFFVYRAHATFLSSVNLSISGQLFETYAVLRCCLESALYGLHIARDSSLAEVWFQRHDSPEQRKLVQNNFSFRTIIKTLEQQDSDVAKSTRTLYEQCIDWGAHPNQQAFMQNMKVHENEDVIRYDFHYLNTERPTLDLALKTTARVGVCVLLIFANVYKERFDILGITSAISTLRQGL